MSTIRSAIQKKIKELALSKAEPPSKSEPISNSGKISPPRHVRNKHVLLTPSEEELVEPLAGENNTHFENRGSYKTTARSQRHSLEREFTAPLAPSHHRPASLSAKAALAPQKQDAINKLISEYFDEKSKGAKQVEEEQELPNENAGDLLPDRSPEQIIEHAEEEEQDSL